MALFKKYNGKSGFDFVCHTTTGYKCLTKIITPEDLGKNIFFSAKHVVGPDGKPYTDIEFECSEQFNKNELLDKAIQCLVAFGFKQVVAGFESCVNGDLAFMIKKSVVPNSIELRLWAGIDGVIIAFDALHELVSADAIDFVHDQESDLENILFESIMEAMGSELKKSPGGEAKAIQRAKELTNYFINGLQAVQ